MKDIERILIFNVNWLGDVLFSTAAIRNIRRNFPRAFIACIIPSSCFQVLKENPYLDEIIIFDDKDRHKSIAGKWDFINLLKRKKFDLVFLLHRSFSRALICKLAGIALIIGYYTGKRGFLLTQKIPLPEKDSIHRIDFYLNIIEKAGLRAEDRFTEFFVSENDLKFAEDFLKRKSVDKDDLVIGINPGGNWYLKRWPKEYWRELADILIEENAAKVIITGAFSDAPLCRDILNRMRNAPIVACGMLNLKQFAALCRRLDFFISADSGPLHIANALGTKKIIALFGPTSPLITGPFPLANTTLLQKDVGCRIPCYVVNCKDNRCMKAITPKEVAQKVSELSKK